ncbi:hypothetical protein SAMN05421688_2803 [Poseidonocella pacifica]|uniref:Uncharacterized protein n=1 Tax=Poseidonocella pacifica TaxID=871651 RepID=A0A1I0Y3W0_9RHOB|nr:hypothetical protein [Poseidonocella pacifica]SFB08045.1 hypothetical protein SAMN05421688_2803 [Poseidonocella pacifica]
MSNAEIFQLTPANQAIVDARERLRADFIRKPEALWPWFPFCKVRVLVVTDGNLDFSDGDFGLATFIRTLLDSVVPARFEVTLGHLYNRSGNAMMEFEPRIKKRVPSFKFDDTDDFAPGMFDVVFLFGISTSIGGRGTASDGNPYPSSQFADTELQAIAEFQNGGGGLFATGDHAALGRFMGQALPRAGKMRLWESTSSNNDLDEVSMGGPRRNDTNRPGDPGSQFEDQADDVPQGVIPKIYSASNWLFKYSFPHPLLCGPNGVIRVMPDHPHEGECVEPTNTSSTLSFKSNLGPEFPNATDAGPKPLPEIISTNIVLAGTTSGGKDPTVGHSFGGICAYNGHRAGVGRVVTDATWHHFVNVNLVGYTSLPNDTVKGQGFLASSAGQAHLENIRAYFRNLAVWLSRKSNISCMNSGWVVYLYHNERVMEAVLTRTDFKFAELDTYHLWEIGHHARDVLGKFASRCQSRRLILDLVWPEYKLELPNVDPWVHFDPKERETDIRINWINGDHILDAALGGALAAVHSEIGDRFEERYDTDEVKKVAQEGARKGASLAVKSLGETMEAFAKQVKM